MEHDVYASGKEEYDNSENKGDCNKISVRVRACVRACVHACVCVSVLACVCVSVLCLTDDC